MSDTKCKDWCGLPYESRALPINGPCGVSRHHYGQSDVYMHHAEPVYCSQACLYKAKLPAKPEPMRSGPGVRPEVGMRIQLPDFLPWMITCVDGTSGEIRGEIENGRRTATFIPVAKWNEGRHVILSTPAAKASPVAEKYVAPPVQMWQCSHCKWAFAGDWKEECPACDYKFYWTGSVHPDAKPWPGSPHRYRDGSTWEAPHDLDIGSAYPSAALAEFARLRSSVAQLPDFRAPVAHAHLEPRWQTDRTMVLACDNDINGRDA